MFLEGIYIGSSYRESLRMSLRMISQLLAVSKVLSVTQYFNPFLTKLTHDCVVEDLNMRMVTLGM